MAMTLLHSSEPRWGNVANYTLWHFRKKRRTGGQAALQGIGAPFKRCPGCAAGLVPVRKLVSDCVIISQSKSISFGQEQDALAPDTSSAHSEADQHPRPPKDDQPPADERLPSPPAGAVASAVLLQLATTLKQSTVSPASDADSTKHHSPAGGAAAAAKAERCQPDAAVGKQAAGATKGGARAGAPGQRKRKSEAAAEPDQQRRKLSAPRNGDAPGNGDAKPAGQATQGPDADLPPHLRRAAAGKGGADGEAARPAAAVQEQRLSLVQQQEQQSAAAAAHPQEPQQLQPGDTKRPGKQADDQPMQDGKTPRPPPSGGRGGRRAESGKPDVKLEPPAVSGAVKRGPDADAAPSGKDGAGPDKRSGAVEKAAEAGAKASYWQQHTRETLRQQQGDAPAAQPEGGYRSQGAGSLDAELRQAGGGGAAAASPVGLHCLGSDGSSQQLGELRRAGHACGLTAIADCAPLAHLP